MKQPRRILAMAVLAVALAATAGALIHHLAWRTPPHLAKRLPPVGAVPPGLNSDQRAAIHLLYSPNPSDRMRGVVSMATAKVPQEIQVPYLVALLADDPKLQPEPPTSPAETWFWKLLGTRWATEDVPSECMKFLGCMRTPVARTVLNALKAEEDVQIRRRLAGVLGELIDNDMRDWLNDETRPVPPPPWRPDPVALDALADVFRTDKAQEVRADRPPRIPDGPDA